MRLTRRLAAMFLAAVLLESVTFAVVYDDLLYFRRSAREFRSTPAAIFARHADSALSRRKLTVQHLEAIAAGAQALGLPELETRALERRVSADPSDRRLRLRLADALRRAGRHHDAERIYLDLLESAGAVR
jgi:thioredoxin-like negative regulator of GroEL